MNRFNEKMASQRGWEEKEERLGKGTGGGRASGGGGGGGLL